MKVDVFIPTVFKDLNKLSYIIDKLILHCKDISDIHISTPDASNMKNFEKNGHHIIFHNDLDVLNAPLKLCRFRSNWIYQQLLKLCQRVTKTEYYFVIDSDIIPLKDFDLFIDEKPVLFSCDTTADESAFLRFIAKATGGDLATWTEEPYVTTNFIADMMLFKRTWVDEMILKYFSSHNEFCLFTLMNTFYRGKRTDSIFIAEYEMYGRYVLKYHNDDIYICTSSKKTISKDHVNQQYQSFSKDDIENAISDAITENYSFLKLESGCCSTNITYVKTK